MKFKIMTSDAILLYCDNNGTIALAKEPKSHQKSKHIEQISRKHVEMRRVDSTDNVIDLLTKQLSQPKMKVHHEKMGLRFVAS